MEHDNQKGADDNQNEGNNVAGAGEGGGRPKKRFSRKDKTIRLLIPSRIAGAIIVNGEQHINRLRAQYEATINVEECQGPESIVHVSAKFENAISIVEEMLKYFEEKEDEYDVRMLIHQGLVGCVIGEGGCKIKENRDKTGCRTLIVFPGVCPQSTDRIVQCVGKAEQAVKFAKFWIRLNKYVSKDQFKTMIPKITITCVFINTVGGFGGRRFDRRGVGVDRGFDRRDGGRRNDRRHDGRGGGPRGMSDFNPNQGPMGGYIFGGFFGGGSGFGNQRGNMGLGNNLGGGGGMGNNMGGGLGGCLSSNMGGGRGNNSGGGNGSGHGMCATQVTIPEDLVGAIIGEAGGRIRRIRMESNAFITIDKYLPGSTDRIITISGSPKQIQTAVYLLQNSVNEDRRQY